MLTSLDTHTSYREWAGGAMASGPVSSSSKIAGFQAIKSADGAEASELGMPARRKHPISFFLLVLALSAFLMGHSLIVDLDFNACFGNYAAAINGERPFHQVSEMSFGELAYSAHRAFSENQLFVGGLGLLPLSPFLVAGLLSKDRQARRFWILSALVAAIIIVAVTCTSRLTDFYDCDLNGVSLGIAVAPMIYTAIALIAVPILAPLPST